MILTLVFVNIGVSLCDHLMHLHTTQQEENILLKRQNEELRAKLQQLGGILTRTKEELARYRVSDGKNPYEQIEEEELLRKKLDVCLLSFYLSNSYAEKGVKTDDTDKQSDCGQESEQDRSQLAENLSSLCSSILKVYMNILLGT